MAKLDKNYRMSRAVKKMYAGMTKEERKIWREALVSSDIHSQGADRMIMNYDISSSGKISK